MDTWGLDVPPPSKKSLIAYLDSAHADTAARKSTCGYIFLLQGSPISWSSRIQRRVALSTTEAEYVAGTEAAREAIWLKCLLDIGKKNAMLQHTTKPCNVVLLYVPCMPSQR